jgi:hypothetical protein
MPQCNYVYEIKVFSIRLSGINQIIDTVAYIPQASHELTNASGIASVYSIKDILPL